MWSSSKNLKVAEEFIKSRKYKNCVNVLLSIHIIGLHPEHLAAYRKEFPTSVVSSICAVDISDLSRYKREEEVLLRGTFCLVLDITEETAKHVKGLKYYQI